MLGLNKPIIPFIVYAIILYIVSFWIHSVWIIMPLVVIPYLYMSIKVPEEVKSQGLYLVDIKKNGLFAYSGGLFKKYIVLSKQAYYGDFRGALEYHEQGHNNNWHTLKKITLIAVYSIFSIPFIYYGINTVVFILFLTFTLVINYAICTVFEIEADYNVVQNGETDYLVTYLQDYSTKNMCNIIRIKMLGG
jgi:hypothetical protein